MTEDILLAADTELPASVLSKLEVCPPYLHQKVGHEWQEFASALAKTHCVLSLSETELADLIHCFVCSNFISNLCLHEPLVFYDLMDSNDLYTTYAPGTFTARLQVILDTVEDVGTLNTELRRFRNREMFRIFWRDLTGAADYSVTVAALTNLAEACISLCLGKLGGWLAAELGTPMNAHNEIQELCVIAVGKLGGKELNLSSDVDLIFTYPEVGETVGGTKSISNELFFLKLSQQLIHSLNQITMDGFVFRVDMRLRPFGNSGPLVMNFKALQSYYQEHGRDWERYALVKARVITGRHEFRERLSNLCRAFVYRHYIDYSAINALRDMKKLLIKEAAAKGLNANIKRGTGGIREIEFMTQVFQLIQGGRELPMQEQNMLAVLHLLEERQHLKPKVVNQLHAAYIFLRNSEHKLQAIHDRQTQMLPTEEMDQFRLAYAMGFASWEAYLQVLNGHRRIVKKHFASIIEEPKSSIMLDDLLVQQTDLQLAWLSVVSDKDAGEILASYEFTDVQEILKRFRLIRSKEEYKKLSNKKRIKYDALVPVCIAAVAKMPNKNSAIFRILSMMDSIVANYSCILTLLENQTAVEQLVVLCHGSPWIAELLSSYPVLVDELVDSRLLYAPLSEQTLAAELRQYLVPIPQQELEQQMNGLRRFKATHVLRVAAADLMHYLPLMKVSDHLTFTASTILREVQNLAINEMIAAHGHPVDEQGEPIKIGFSIIGYGKLGGIELSYGSDLDLVFIHDEIIGDPQTNGEKSISLQVFYTRLGQKIIQIIGNRTTEGLLYEVDTRLRPRGSSGLLVTSVNSFASYLLKEAWTWEHQALVRAQAITGRSIFQARFNAIRKQILSLPREETQLQKEVISMRDKMRESNIKRQKGMYDVKQGIGGMTDIEFLAQYAVLRWSYKYPSLMTWSDNIRIFESCVKVGLLSDKEELFLCDAYRGLRAIVHQNDLQNAPALVPESECLEWRDGVRALWARFLGSPQ